MKLRLRWPPWTLWRFAIATTLVWVAAPFVTGKQEAWDDDTYYLCAIAAAGFIAGLFERKPSWWMYLGAVLGNVIYPLIWLASGPLAVLGCAFGVLYSGVTAAAGVIACSIANVLVRRA